jgi:hypothetical protein
MACALGGQAATCHAAVGLCRCQQAVRELLRENEYRLCATVEFAPFSSHRAAGTIASHLRLGLGCCRYL